MLSAIRKTNQSSGCRAVVRRTIHSDNPLLLLTRNEYSNLKLTKSILPRSFLSRQSVSISTQIDNSFMAPRKRLHSEVGASNLIFENSKEYTLSSQFPLKNNINQQVNNLHLYTESLETSTMLEELHENEFLSNFDNTNETKISWEKSKNDYVFKTLNSSGKSCEIPMMDILRSTVKYNSFLIQNSRSSNDRKYSNYGLNNKQQMSYFSTTSNTDLKSKQENDNNNNNMKKSSFSSSSSKSGPNTKLGTTQIPTPASSLPNRSNPLETLKQTTPKNIVRKGMDLTISLFRTIITFLLHLPSNTYYYISHPKERQEALDKIRKTVKDEVHHYWVGTKLLWADIQTAQSLLTKTLHGSSLTRRERRQLLRTVSDLFRLIPFSMFIIIPFMEFALPFALKIFPNLLPSTYQDSLKAEEDMKRELKTRIAMAQFFQE